MPRRLTPAERELRAQIGLLSAHIRESKRNDRAAAKAVELANRPPPRSRAQVRLNRLRAIVTHFEAVLAAGRPQHIPAGMSGSMQASQANLEYLTAQSEIPSARLALACHVRNDPSLPEAADLLPWALEYLAEREAVRLRIPR
jgi:hypothetical protein